MIPMEGQVRIPSGCAISAVISREGKRMDGTKIIDSMRPMHDRSNGLGGGFAAYGIYPEYKEFYALHIFYNDNISRNTCEQFLKDSFEIVRAENIPTRKHKRITDEPLIWRYFVSPLASVLSRMQLDEKEYAARIVMKINTEINGAYVFSSGKNMGAFKAVGYPEDVGEFYRLDGLRVTDKEAIEIVQMVLAGKINKSLVNLIQTLGGRAIGLCGTDGHMIEAERLDDVHGFVGNVTNVDTTPILDVLEKGYIPVIATVGCDNDGNVYNINADTAAARIAGALGAESLISMTDIRGLLHDRDNDESLIPVVHASEAPELIREGIISGGMIPKVDCCIDAIRRGVKKVFILDGRVPHSILIETLTDAGIGTMFI